MAQKLRDLIKAYYYFFDHKLKNTTIIIGLVGTLILCVGIFIGGKYQINQHSAKANILEIKADQIMDIGGKQYRVSFEKIDQ